MRRLLGTAWHPDIVSTLRDVCVDARRRHSTAGYTFAVLAEITNLLATVVRARLGRRMPITGGHPPQVPRKAGSTMQRLRDDLLGGWRRLARQPRAGWCCVRAWQ